jgi:hypothetical protein
MGRNKFSPHCHVHLHLVLFLHPMSDVIESKKVPHLVFESKQSLLYVRQSRQPNGFYEKPMGSDTAIIFIG